MDCYELIKKKKEKKKEGDSIKMLFDHASCRGWF
jgi:hypothetical protein